jgi:outer membrane protein OmpA-like peptidoglycan-associated protein
MQANKITARSSARRRMSTIALCAGLLGASACAHKGEPRERTSVSAVTNKEVADSEGAEGKTRQHYTEVSDRDALGHGTHQPPLAGDTNVASATDTGIRDQGAGSCELEVYFDTDSTRLKQGAEQNLDRVAECLKRREIDHATIVGQTDPSGSAEHNDQLGLERARVVAEYLRNRGVPEDQIRVRSKGELASAQQRDLWPVERRAGVNTTR